MNYINNKNKIYKVVFSLIGFILMLSGVSYAYFVSKINNNESASTIAGEAANLELEFKEGSNQINGDDIFPGWSDTKTFTVKNKSSIDVYYNLYISDIKNELMSESISYKIESTDGGYNLEKVLLPSTDGIIKTGIYIKANTTHTYKVTTYYNNLDIDQSNEKGKTFSFKIYIKSEHHQSGHYDFNFIGTGETFIAPYTGNYKIELWGAQGGSSLLDGGIRDISNLSSICLADGTGKCAGGYGSYTSGDIYLNKNEKLYIYVGGKGTTGIEKQLAPGGYNGGGSGTHDNSDNEANGAGGGATDVRLVSGLWNDAASLNSRIMVAAGGGGASDTYSGLAGGGIVNSNTTILNRTASKFIEVNQTSGYKFGIGQDGVLIRNNYPVAGAGGGYYGGYALDSGNNFVNLGGGGSSFISGHTGCVAITSDTIPTPKSGCTTSTVDNSCSIHYSGKIFTNTVMIDGLGYSWTNTKGSKAQMPKPDGDNYNIGIGNIGNGYARITYQDYEQNGLQILYDATNNDGKGYNESSTIWKDLTDNGNDAVINGATWSDNALLFDGVDDWAAIKQLNYDTYTLEVVIKPTQVVSGERIIIANYEGGGFGLTLQSNKFKNQIYSKENNTYYNQDSHTAYVANRMYNLVGSYDGNILKIYVNDNLESTLNLNGTIGIPQQNTIMAIGTNPWKTSSAGGYYPGYVYSVRLYNRALTEEEISKNYNIDKSRYSF